MYSQEELDFALEIAVNKVAKNMFTTKLIAKDMLKKALYNEKIVKWNPVELNIKEHGFIFLYD